MALESQTISVLVADAEIGKRVSKSELASASRAALARVISVSDGEWNLELAALAPGGLGLLVLEGLIVRSTTLVGRTSTELLGRDDLIRPWEDGSDTVPISLRVHWSAQDPSRLAILDEDFVERVSPWPVISATLLERSARRARRLVFQTAMLENPLLDVRLLLLFWHLAERWGRVGPDGVLLPIHITHKMLGRLVRAQRPSVSASLRRLAEGGMLIRREDGGWMLHGNADAQLEALSKAS